MIDPASKFPIESELVEILVPEFKEIDKLFREESFDIVLKRVLSLYERWPDHPAIGYRLISAYRATRNPLLAKKHILLLRAGGIPSGKTSSILSQSLFHCFLELGDLDSAELEARQHFSQNPDGHPPYMRAYEELLRLRDNWTDEEIQRKILASK